MMKTTITNYPQIFSLMKKDSKIFSKEELRKIEQLVTCMYFLSHKVEHNKENSDDLISDNIYTVESLKEQNIGNFILFNDINIYIIVIISYWLWVYLYLL